MKYGIILIALFIIGAPVICLSSGIPRYDVKNILFESVKNDEINNGQASIRPVHLNKFQDKIIIPDFMDSPVKGASLFYLDGRREENLPLVIQKLASGNKQISERLVRTVDEMKRSGVNWVRILISSGFYRQFDYLFSDYDYDKDVYPTMSRNEAMKINAFLDYLRKGADGLKIELVLSAGFIDGTNMRDKENDALFFESILRQIDTSGIELVMLGGDIMPCNIIPLLVDDTVCDENGVNDDWNDAEWIKYQLSYFTNNKIDKLRNLNYSFDTITYPTVGSFRTYLKWVRENVASYVPVVSVSAYYAQEGATEQDYISHFNTLINAYLESGLDKPFWLDEYGFGLKGSFREEDAFLYFKGFLQATRCKDGVDSSLFYPSMAWVVGSDRIHSLIKPDGAEYCGLFLGYDLADYPVVSQSWELLKWFNTAQGACSSQIPNYVRAVVPNATFHLLLQ